MSKQRRKPLSKKLHSDWSRKTPIYLEKSDKRYAQYLKHLKINGFCDSETWNMHAVFAMFIHPRLVRFKELNNGHPGTLTAEQWDATLDKMIFAFHWLMEEGNDEYFIMTDEVRDASDRQCDEGLKLFGEYFRHLWW